MLPYHYNTNPDGLNIYKKSFTDSLCEGYRIDLKPGMRNSGTRCIYYYEEEHSLLVSHVSSRRVHIINLMNGKIRWFDHHGSTVRSLIVCNHEILSASWDGTVCVTNFDSLKLRLILTEKTMGRSPQVRVSPDYKFLYSYTYDSDKNPVIPSNSVRKWSLANGELENVIRLSGYHRSTRRCGSCTIYDNRLYTVSDSGYFQVFDPTTGTKLDEYLIDEELQTLCDTPLYGNLLFAGNKGNLYLFDPSIKRIIKTIKGHDCDVRDMLSRPRMPDILFSISFDGTMKLWKIPEFKLLTSVNVNRNLLWTLTFVNNLVLTGGEEGDIWIYDTSNTDDIRLKGRLVVYHESYVFLPVESNLFYTNDLTSMIVLQKENGMEVVSQFGEYLLNTCNNFKVMQDLFSPENSDSIRSGINSKNMYQIPQSFS
jgi:WD40 repeat protein